MDLRERVPTASPECPQGVDIELNERGLARWPGPSSLATAKGGLVRPVQGGHDGGLDVLLRPHPGVGDDALRVQDDDV